MLIWRSSDVIGGVRQRDPGARCRFYMLKTSALTRDGTRVSKNTERTSFANPGEVRQTCS